jgi:hypothetical protein
MHPRTIATHYHTHHTHHATRAPVAATQDMGCCNQRAASLAPETFAMHVAGLSRLTALACRLGWAELYARTRVCLHGCLGMESGAKESARGGGGQGEGRWGQDGGGVSVRLFLCL